MTTLRHRIADWISGGELTRALWRANTADFRVASWKYCAISFGGALETIIACETPSANATVRRMAKIAREALE